MYFPESTLTDRSQLGGTPLEETIAKHKKVFRDSYSAHLEKMRNEMPALLPEALDMHMLSWAHDMYVSRRFPPALGLDSSECAPPEGNAPCSTLSETLGIMLPLMDVLNHKPMADVDWMSSEAGVAFHVGKDARQLRAGDEVFNNYGNKGNGSLLISYGFSIHNNPFDSYGLRLLVQMSASDPPSELGIFHILRSDNPEVVEGYAEQIPSALWRAVSNPKTFLLRKMHEDLMAENRVLILLAKFSFLLY
jgi:hypothetical protein